MTWKPADEPASSGSGADDDGGGEAAGSGERATVGGRGAPVPAFWMESVGRFSSTSFLSLGTASDRATSPDGAAVGVAGAAIAEAAGTSDPAAAAVTGLSAGEWLPE